MNTDRLHNMIERYFSGDLSVREEQLLLKRLLEMKEKDPMAEEALAVMSWTHLQSSPAESDGMTVVRKSRSKPSSFRLASLRIASCAAAAAVIISGVFLYLNRHEYGHPVCYAYIEGKYIQNPDEVSTLISSQLEEMSAASNETTKQALSELEEMRRALEDTSL